MAKTVQPMCANDRLKQSFEGKFALSLILATCVHLLVFLYFPEMSTNFWEEEATVAVAIIPMEEIAIPVAPKRLASEEFLRHLVKAYPQELRDAGVGGPHAVPTGAEP